MTDSDIPLVSVCMITYNHESYISEAIEGFLLQRCKFPVELVIGEDHSTDLTRTICERYATQYSNIIRLLPSEKNLGMIPNFQRTIMECKGKYIAMCEGDDYWTDPYKLQKQVDILETHPEIGLVHTDCDVFYQEENRYNRSKNRTKNLNYSGFDNPYIGILLGKYDISTCTVLVNKDLLLNADKDDVVANQDNLQGDLPRWLYVAKHSKMEYLNESTTTYRVTNGSVSRQTDIIKRLQFRASSKSIRKEFADKDNLPPKIINEINGRYYTALINLHFYCGELNEINSIKKIISIKKVKMPFKTRIKVLFSMNHLSYNIIKNLYKLKVT